ncbi:M16 family metallopeptidase [Bowmanella dokdonensis]|uniref:Insulinase family protein n=1 Tax=Bowmanella dokdonensis TaxID=751969 RepID=A0A939DN73_9ALTE|nr:pitrilysin family protein [Bowmanella dokdonensis]MBN7825888.1 insulinase family protein [Bowmanella dokdonensis]
MKRICKVFIQMTLAALALPALAGNFTLPAYQVHKLDNGLTLYLMEQDEVPLVDMVVTVKAGAIDDQTAGQARLTAANLLLGTQSMSRAEFESKLDFVGAQVSAEASLEATHIKASMASRDLDLVLGMIRDAVLHPALNGEEFSKHKQRYLAGLVQKTESPKAVIKDYFNSQLFAGHPYASLVDGSTESVESIDLEQVRAFHQRWYQPDNVALVLAGNFNAEQLKQKLQDLFGQWQGKAQTRPPLTAPKPLEQAHLLLVDKADASESTFMIGGPGIARSNPDYVPLQVINTVLGGRFTSWLNDELRVNSGLTYGARSHFETMQQGGSFYISTFTRTETTKEAIDLALKTYAKLWQQGIDTETLESAKAYVKGQFPPRFETSSELADLMAQMYIYGFDEDFINGFSARVNQLTTERAKAIIARYFPKEKLQFVVVGKAADIKEKLSEYGKVRQTSIQAP